MFKNILFSFLVSAASIAFGGPFVSGGDPTAVPIVSGMVDGFEVKNKPKGYKVIIKLVDASRADAPSKILLKVTYEKVKTFPVLFTLSGLGVFSTEATYQVEVLVDSDGNGRISKGDYINTTAATIEPFHPDGFVYLKATEVK